MCLEKFIDYIILNRQGKLHLSSSRYLNKVFLVKYCRYSKSAGTAARGVVGRKHFDVSA